MSMFHKSFTIACLPATLLMPGLALADEAPPAVQALLANLERQMDAKPGYETLTVDGSGNVTITNLTLTKPAEGDDPGYTLRTGEIVLSGVTEMGPGFWEVGTAKFSNVGLDVTGKDVAISASLPGASAEGWYIRDVGAAPSAQEKLVSSGTFARKMTGGPLAITSAGQSVTVDSLESTWEGDPATGAGTFTSKISNATIPEAALMAMGDGGMLRQLGYTSLNLDISSQSALAVMGDKLGYDFGFTLKARDIGSLGFKGAVADIPVEAYNALMAAQKDGEPADLDAYGPALQNVIINSAALRFEDASIIGKALPLIAAAQGMDEKTFVASIPPTVQLMLVQMQNDAFTKQAVDALTQFLADPKSLTVSISPASPLKVSDVSALQQVKPGDAITRLGLSLKAND